LHLNQPDITYNLPKTKTPEKGLYNQKKIPYNNHQIFHILQQQQKKKKKKRGRKSLACFCIAMSPEMQDTINLCIPSNLIIHLNQIPGKKPIFNSSSDLIRNPL
jgi:hypothetical protein